MRKIKVWGGTHPDELGPFDLVASLERDPIPNVSPGVVNTTARRGQRIRPDGINMNHAYPGSPDAKLPEERRAHEVLKECEGFDIILDMHGMASYDDEDHAWISAQGVSGQVLGFLAGGLGIRRLVLGDHNQLIKHVTNGVLVEISSKRYANDLDVLRGALHNLANSRNVERAEPADFTWYKLKPYGARADMFDPNNVPDGQQQFEPVPQDIAPYLDSNNPQSLHWLSTPSKTPNGQGYWAELGWSIPTPDASHWPK